MNILKALVNGLKALTPDVKALVHLIKALIERHFPLITGTKALMNRHYPLMLGLKALIEQPYPLILGPLALMGRPYPLAILQKNALRKCLYRRLLNVNRHFCNLNFSVFRYRCDDSEIGSGRELISSNFAFIHPYIG